MVGKRVAAAMADPAPVSKKRGKYKPRVKAVVVLESIIAKVEPAEEEEEDDDDESDEESSDGEPIIPLLAGREKRYNAGNRMRALLDEESTLQIEEEFKEELNDDEFVTIDEEDIFDSDFGSTDEDAPELEEDPDKQLAREAREARRDAKGKKKKGHTPFLPAFARQTKAQVKASTSRETLDQPPRNRRRTSAVLHTDGFLPQRESSRKSAVDFKNNVEGRLKETELRRASMVKVVRKTERSFTQADLISTALETEDINRASLLAFYAAEEDRLATERLAGQRYEIPGPKITFLSRSEGGGRGEGKGVAEVERKKDEELERGRAEADGRKIERGRRRLIEVIGEAGKQGWRSGIDPVKAASVAVPAASNAGDSAASTSGQPFDLNEATAPQPAGLSSRSRSSMSKILLSTDDPSPSSPFFAPSPASTSSSSRAPRSNATGPQEQPSHTRNYLIISDLPDQSGAETTSQEMSAIFGEHYDWTQPAPLLRPRSQRYPKCAITNLPAPYLDPRTATPYANTVAYQTLTSLIKGDDYSYNDKVGVWGSKRVGLGLEVENEERKKRASRPSLFLLGAAISDPAPKLPTIGIPEAVLKSQAPLPSGGAKVYQEASKLDKGKGKEISATPVLTPQEKMVKKAARVEAKRVKQERREQKVIARLAKEKAGGVKPKASKVKAAKTKKQKSTAPAASGSKGTKKAATPPVPMVTTMQDGQSVMGAGAKARAKKVAEREEKARLAAKLEAEG